MVWTSLHSDIVIQITSGPPLFDSFFKWSVHFVFAKGDLVHFLLDKVTQDGNRFTIFTVQSKLTATGVLVQSYQRATIWLSHDIKFLFDDVDTRSPDRVRVP